jgi:hypothetical protein
MEIELSEFILRPSSTLEVICINVQLDATKYENEPEEVTTTSNEKKNEEKRKKFYEDRINSIKNSLGLSGLS